MNTRLKELLKLEQDRQNNGLELIASENFASKSVRKLCGSILTNKYAEGYPGRRYYGGCKYVDQVEQLAIDTLCQIFHCNYANVQPHSGSSANMVAYRALLNKGDKILSLSLEAGGHLSHGSPVNFSSRDYAILHYNLAKDGRIDYEGLEEIARNEKPRLILAGFSAYPYQVNFERIGKVAKEVGAYFMVDMAHIAGLIAAGYHPSPFPYADIVTSTTHKTLRGPRGGIILTNSEEIIKKVNFALFPGLQGGPLENIIGAKAQCFLEATTPEYKEYIKNVLINTKACADEFTKLGDVASGTETHLFLLNTKKSFGLTGKESEVKLEEINITVNKNMLPNDDERPNVTSGIRMGFAALTTRGIKEEGAREVARIIHGYLGGTLSNEDAKQRVKNITDNLLRVEDID
jgi:glycine hydroxymethyltransferase